MKKNIYILSLMTLILDQFTKFLVVSNLKLLEKITIIPNFFDILYVRNEGGAWGILSNQTIFLTIISALAFILINKYLLNKTNFNRLEVITYGLLMGGILGNFIDRVINGYVIDFFSFNIFGYAFPVFNIADIAVVISVFLLIIEVVRSDIHEHNSRKRKD